MDERIINGFYLFKALIKIGAKWQGDVISRKWTEALFVDEKLEHQLQIELEIYEEGIDYKREGQMIWIA